MLDQLGVALVECVLALHSMRLDVGITLDELERDLRRAQESARVAFGAASLVDQGADLAGSWTDYPSRPKAIFARHRVAFDHGAERKLPAVSAAERLEQAVARSPRTDSDPFTPLKRCGHSTPDGTACRRRVVCVGEGAFADHCVDHLNDLERRLSDDHRRAMVAVVVKAQRDEITRIAAGWLVHRRRLHEWLNHLIDPEPESD